MTPIPLTNEILDRWLSAVERESGEPTGYTAPASGADGAIESVFDGRRVPPELMTLWSWRTIPYRRAPETGPAARPMSPAESAEVSRDVARLYEEQVREWGPGGWSTDYVIWSQVDRIWLIADFSELGLTSPVYASADADFTEPPARIADSLGELFEHWTALIASGAEYYDGYWTYRDDRYARYPIHGSPR